MNYFERVLSDESEVSCKGVVSFHRRCLDDTRPQWEKIDRQMSKCHVKSHGLIENQNEMLQVDFANRFLGGGVLGQGCVQEEIRFVTHPELLVSRLFTQSLLDNEAVIVQGQ